jgi:cyclic beta-1,2-glucan synthetase
MSVSREHSRHISFKKVDAGTLIMQNPYNLAAKGIMLIRGENGEVSTDTAAFLCGEWGGGNIESSGSPCAVVYSSGEIGAEQTVKMRFELAFSADENGFIDTDFPNNKGEENSIKINTGDKEFDEFVSTFLPHQVVKSRIWGRCGFFQCSGAYGFRDQLQDTMSVADMYPELAKRQILRCCAVQFIEGDVLHWWHRLPKSGAGLKGVRTRFSDDLLWLPLAVAEYIRSSGDCDILSLPVAYIEAPVLEDGKQETYISPTRSKVRESVFEHCIRAIEKGCNFGQDGIPLIGCGDWNDGFSNIGTQGKGRSVWLAMFLALVLEKFAPVCQGMAKPELKEKYLSIAAKLKQDTDDHCWDGDQYIRAFFDDGTPIGSKTSKQCRIDLLPQSFAVFSDMPNKERVDLSLMNAYETLYDKENGLVKLFAPPFADADPNPGYISAYPEGIRENGGQYTHAAVWFAMALAKNGEPQKAWDILRAISPTDRNERYLIEPYALAGDIYANPNAYAHGGWSHYTGAAGWYFRAVTKTIFGLNFRGDKLYLDPKLPDTMREIEIEIVKNNTHIHLRLIKCKNAPLHVDGEQAEFIPLDGGIHKCVLSVD